MTDPGLLDRLAEHRVIGQASRAEHEWLVAHGEVRQMNAGELLNTKDVPIEWLFIILSGTVAIYADRAGGESKLMEWHGGDVTGMLPYSRLASAPGNSYAQETTTVLAVHQSHFTDLVRDCPMVTALLVHSMLDRARHFTKTALHDEKLVSLGKLSAGLAHELNNPASAIERAASLLPSRLEAAERAARVLGGTRLSDAQFAAVDELRASCLMKRVEGVRTPLEHAEREEAIADWLAAHGVDEAASDALAETSVTMEALDRVAAAVDGEALGAALHWAAAGCSVGSLATDIHEASMRISGLVLAIKGFTHMDQAAVAEPVDVTRSLNNTVTVLRAKARGKAASVVVDVEPGLPHARGFAGELNQIWANLIDNALDAIADSGRVEVHASHDRGRVVVRVIDDGPGIPEDIRARIFEPFFTTKPMGLGTGLGLDIVHRLVRHNDGDYVVESKPGRTEFRVSLPVASDGGAPGAA